MSENATGMAIVFKGKFVYYGIKLDIFSLLHVNKINDTDNRLKS